MSDDLTDILIYCNPCDCEYWIPLDEWNVNKGKCPSCGTTDIDIELDEGD